MPNIEIGAYQTHQRHTCIVVGHSKTSVEIIVLDATSGLRVSDMTESAFNKEYKPIPGYPLHKAIEQYIEFGTYCGMTEQVKELFQSMLEGIAKKEKVDTKLALTKLQSAKVLSSTPAAEAAKNKAAKRKAAEDDSPPWDEDDQPSVPETKKKDKASVSGKASDKLPAKGKESKAVKQPAKEDKKAMATTRATKVPAATTQKNTGSIKTGKQSAAQMFRDLILTGSYDDDQIFKMVQKEYGLDDSKRNYVAYYRRELKQKGLI